MPPARRAVRLCVLIGVLVASSSILSFAATVLYHSDAELVARSERVVRGRVLSARSERSSDGRIHTITTLAVLEDFSGHSDSVIEIRELGGRVGNDFLYVGGAVRYEVGSEVVVCLERSQAGWLRSIAMGLSKFDVVPSSDGDPVLRRNLSDVVVAGGAQPPATQRLSSFRELAERVRGLRSVRPARLQALESPAVVAEPFVLFGFRWTEPDGGIPVRWFIDTSASPPVPGDASGELQTALAGWTNPPQASIVLNFAGFTYQGAANTRGPWPSLGSGAGVVFFEDPLNEIGGSVLAIGGGYASGDGGVVNGTSFSRMISGFVIFQNAAALPANFRESRDFMRVLEHEVGHGIGLGHTPTDGSVLNPAANIMYPACCNGSTPIPPAIGPDDLAGIVFLYPAGASSQCTYALSPGSTTVQASANSFGVTITTDTGCPWSVSGLPFWLSVDVTSGTGNGSVQFSVARNTVPTQRTVVVSIGSQPFTVTQQACPCTVSPTSVTVPARGGTVTIGVTSSFCDWTASSSVWWIAVTGGIPATGSGTVTLNIERNTGLARSGVVLVAGRSIIVAQADGVTTNADTDFDGDGHPDLIWHHQGDGRIAVWYMDGISLRSADLVTPDRVADTNWKVVGVWDPNGDGNPDLLWRHVANGSIATWFMRGRTMISADPLTPGVVGDTNWSIVATADMDRDGNTDLIWQHITSGQLGAWLMNGTTLREAISLFPSSVADTNWRIVGSGDFDENGQPDLVWQHQTSGEIAVWFMNGLALVSATLVSPPRVADTSWQIRAVADVNGDRQPDLIWQNTATGHVAAWRMRGLTMIDAVYLSPAVVSDTGWRIAAPR